MEKHRAFHTKGYASKGTDNGMEHWSSGHIDSRESIKQQVSEADIDHDMKNFLKAP